MIFNKMAKPVSSTTTLTILLMFAFSGFSLVQSSPLALSRESTTVGSKSTENDVILKNILISALQNGGATISLEKANSGGSSEVPQQQSILEFPQQSAIPATSSESLNSYELLKQNYLINSRMLQLLTSLTGSNRLSETTHYRLFPTGESGFSRMNTKRTPAMGVDLPDYILHINKGRNIDYSSLREKMQKSG